MLPSSCFKTPQVSSNLCTEKASRRVLIYMHICTVIQIYLQVLVV